MFESHFQSNENIIEVEKVQLLRGGDLGTSSHDRDRWTYRLS